MNSRLFWKLFVTYAVLTLASMVAIAWTVSRSQALRYERLFEGRLRDSAAMLKIAAMSAIESGRTLELQRDVKWLGDSTKMRLTVIAADGRVLADSFQREPEAVFLMDNHKDRPEIQRALVRGTGESQRYSDTVGTVLHYFALRVDREDGQHVGWVRTALPENDLQEHVAALKKWTWSVAGAASLALLLATLWLVSRIVQPITRLTRAAESITAGNYRDRIYVAYGDELGQLAQAFNRMQRDMDSRVTQLRETNQRLSTVLEGMTDGVIAIDEHQSVVFANRAAGELMRFFPGDVQGKSLLEIVRSHTLHELVVDLLSHPGQQQRELEWGDPGKLRLLVNATSLEGTPSAGIVLVIHNLTEQHRLEVMRRDFVANVSHELKTPLSSIKAYAETLLGGAIDDEQNRARFVREIAEQADRLNQLINDLLSLASIEAGTQHLEMLLVEVGRVVDICVKEQRRAAAEKQIELVVEPGPELQVEADEGGLREILINLIDNAIKYTPKKGRITVGWRSHGRDLAIQVRDTGIGIPQDLQSRVFERFFRVDKARSREMGGTGLGLAIVKHLTQSFRGRVEVQSEPEQGSCFTVWLPIATSDSRQHVASTVSAPRR